MSYVVRVATVLLFLAAVRDLSAVPELNDYLPSGTAYDDSIPKPADVLGFQVGEYHARHDQVVAYFEALAAASPRFSLERYGLTHEKRELLLATITSPDNHGGLEGIRTDHLKAVLANGEVLPPGDRPVVTWLAYGVHGNEPSGTNAALLVAYHLAAARGEKIDLLLENAVVLLDPAVNPDGLSRFAHWANTHRGKNLVADPSHREHTEGWPSGRTNHYWFDLNRDWLLLTQPESKGRLKKFHEWKPNVLADFHEMATDSTYFFQPGVPTRQNPNTPGVNLELTRQIAEYHASAFDGVGGLYFTEERFDDFYYGKGSTYPDVNGGIGILFEQASARGHLQENSYGTISFPTTIRNQFLTSLSTLKASIELREKLLDYQEQFYRTARSDASNNPVRAFVFGGSGDRVRESRFLELLQRHDIAVYRLSRTLLIVGQEYPAGAAWIVPLSQPQYRLILSLFERRTEFSDRTFYDVSTWTMPLTFGLPHADITADEFVPDLVGELVGDVVEPTGRFPEVEDPYAYIFEWSAHHAPRAAYRLLRKGLRMRVATEPFEVLLGDRRRSFDYGTVILPLGIQDQSFDVSAAVREIATRDGIDVATVSSGLTAKGVDLGSPKMLELREPHPLLVVGDHVSAYEAGEVWHLLDQEFDIFLSVVEASVFDEVDLTRYTHVILVSGKYSEIFKKQTVEKLERWVRRGGVLIATRTATRWAASAVLRLSPKLRVTTAASAESRQAQDSVGVSYVEYESLRAKNRIGGAIFEAEIDRSHPMGFGYQHDRLAVFRNSTVFMDPGEDAFATVARYTSTPLLSGYVSGENLRKLKGSAVVCATRLDEGTVIRIVDNPNFRGVWYGTKKLFLNALFLGHTVKQTAPLAGE